MRDAVSLAGMPTGKKDTLVTPPHVAYSRRDLARGFFDADGSIGFTAKRVPFLSLVTRSHVMATWWCGVVAGVTGAQRSVRSNTRDGIVNVMVQTDAAVALARWLYRYDDLALPRKSRIANDVATWRRPAGMRAPYRAQAWSTEQDERVMSDDPVSLLAQEMGRTVSSVVARRWRLRNSALKGT